MLCVVMVILPWQTRWMFGGVPIAGLHTEFGIMSVYAVEVVLLLGIVLALWCDRRKGIRLHIPEAHQLPVRLGAVLVVVAVLGTAFADRSAFSMAVVLHLAMASVMFVALLFDHIRIRSVLLSFCVGLLPPLVLGGVQVLTGATPASTLFGLASRDAAQIGDSVFTVNGERVLRAYGSFSHPNIFGGYLGVGLFAWWSGFEGRKKTLRSLQIGVVGTGLFLVGILVTGSRSALLGVMLGLVLIMVVKAMRSMRVARVLVVVLGVLVIAGSLAASVALPDVAAGLRGGGVNEERSLTERATLYADYLPFLAVTNPVVGHGMGSYVLSYADFDPSKSIYGYQPIHNVPLLILIELGALGVLAVALWAASIDRINFARFPNTQALYAFGMGNVILVIMFYDHYLWSSWSGLVLCAVVMAMTVRLGEKV